MENKEYGLVNGDEVFKAVGPKEQGSEMFYKKHKREVECNLTPTQKYVKCPLDFSSGDDCSTTYELKMENTIVQQNNTIMSLQEDLEAKSRTIVGLQEELTRKDVLIQEMEETILSQNDTLESLQEDVQIKEKSISDIKDELIKKDENIQEIEETMVKQNSVIGSLECELQNKNKEIINLKEELQTKDTLIQEMNNSLSSKNSILCFLQNEIVIKNENIREIAQELFRGRLVVEEAEGLKTQISELTNQVKGLEEILKVKNEMIQQSQQWHIEMKKELDAQSNLMLDREENLRLEHDKEVEKLKQEFLEQFSSLSDKKSLLESFLEHQVSILLNKLKDLALRGIGNKNDIDSFCRLYEEELNKVKSTVSQFSEFPHSGNFIKKLEDFNERLAACFNSEESIKSELKSKIEELTEIQDEMKQCKKKCDELMSNEKNLLSKLTKTEIELNALKDEKLQLQQRLAEANNHYEKATIDFNRDRIDIEKKYRQTLESYETDLLILNKSLQELLGNIPSSFDPEGSFSVSGDSSLVSLNSDVNSMISNPNIFNAQKIVTKCLYELGKLRNDVKKISQENKTLRLAIELKNKTCEEKDDQLRRLTHDSELIKSKYTTIEEEKKYLENKIRYMVEENTNLNLNIQSLNSKISELNDALNSYKEEINSLKKIEQSMKSDKENQSNINATNSKSVFVDKNKMSGVSDSELLHRNDLHTPDISFQSLPDSVSKDAKIYTSTPFHGTFGDFEAGGEAPQAKTLKGHLDLQNSLLKWIEKCQELDKENKLLTLKVEDLELLNQDLKFTVRCVKEEMELFEGKQQILEKKLNSFVSLKKQYMVVRDDSELKDLQIKKLLKELENMKNERSEMFHKNVELEEMYRMNVSKLTEFKHVQNIAVFTDTATKTFNEKIREIIHLKAEILSIKDEKNSLSQKVDLLLESNNTFVAELNNMNDKLCSYQEELEKTSSEKLAVLSSNKLLKKEIELLQLRVNYLSSLRDTHWCSPNSMKLFEDMQQELLTLVRNTFESKLEHSSSLIVKDVGKDTEKLDPLNLPEILKMLSLQLRDEKVDFEQKVTEFQRIIHSIQDGKALNESWIVQIDKMLKNILEEMKYHKEQYFRIEEALRSTGKFHDELQKQKDELRIKEHEIASAHKKYEEERMKSKKWEGHLKMLEQEILEKNELIKVLIDQKDKMEREIIDLQKQVSDAEFKYETNLKALEWKSKSEELKKSKEKIEDKIVLMQNSEEDFGGNYCLSKGIEETEQLYNRAVEELKIYLKAELSNSILQIQEEHKEQVERLERIISEQAVRIGFLLKKSNTVDKETDEPDPDVLNTNEDLRKQFDIAVYALQQLHQEELQLLRLQLEAEKHNDIYQAVHGKQQSMPSVNMPNYHLAKNTEDYNEEKRLVKKLESILRQDFLKKLKTFLLDWYSAYKQEVSQIEDVLSGFIENFLQSSKEGKEEIKTKEEDINTVQNQYKTILESAKNFICSLEDELNSIKNNLENVFTIYTKVTLECLEKIKILHSPTSDYLQLKQENASLIKEKEELEKRLKNAIELLHADHKTEEDKIQVILTDLKKCCESGCDPNTLLKIKDDLEEKHKKELEDLRAYYVQMCSNLEKQYSEDVNSLHSRMLSLSSSCSDDIISDQMLFDKGGSGDHAGNMILSELLPDNVVLENLSTEQLKLIEDLNYKCSEEIKEMKRELESKYTKKIEQLQERLSTFIYNNELDISVRCIKDEVMRDCKLEIENIEKEITSRMLPYHDDIESLKSDNECSSLGKELWKGPGSDNDIAWEQLTVDLMGECATKDALNKVTKELLLVALKNTCDSQHDNFINLSQFVKVIESTLFTIENKLKDKENQLLSLQNKLNSFSQIILSLASKCNNFAKESKFKNDLFNNAVQLEKMLEEGYNKDTWPPELAQICKVFKNKYEDVLKSEKEKYRCEIEKIKQSLNKEKAELEKSFESDINSRPSIDEFDRLIKERDSLKQMTCTLKSAVSQLVSYLNTCEDELNKTVVDELLKICDETPRKGSEFKSLDCSPNFRRVHFAPEVGISDLDESEDISSVLRLQLDSCLSKLKLEAASLLGLTALQPPPANLNKQIENLHKENEELLQEISELKSRIEKNQNDSLELREQLFSESIKENGSTFLQDKAQCLLNSVQRVPPESVKLLEDLAKFGDKLINELQKERTDLQQQIEAADKQLKSTRQFLEEQAVERETERDEYMKEVTNLQNQLKERGKNWTSHERFTSEVSETVLQKKGKFSLSVEELELQLKESNMLLEETERKKELVESELKEAIDKVWVLRDIIANLEAQLNTKSEKEARLEQKLDELEAELYQQNDTQYAMAQELESLRSQSMDDGYLEQIKQLQENIKVQFNSTVVRQMKAQIREMEKGIEQRTKELEALYLTNSSNSLSSPSEEVSLREQLEWNRCKTPEQCPSPVALPVEELTKLQEKLLRLSRAEEVLFKRLRDQQLTSVKLSAELEEMHGEREVMQLQLKKQMVQLAEANNKIDDLRHKVEMAQTAANKDLISQVQELKEKYALAEQNLDSLQNQLIEHKGQLAYAEETINKQQMEIRNLAHCDHEVVDSLRLELAAVTAERNKLEELLDKYKRDFNLDVMNALLADKNEDIDQLQHTVALLQSQEDDDKHGSCNSKGYRVSFATEVEESSVNSEGMKLRDAPETSNLDITTENIQVFGGAISPIRKESDIEFSPPTNLALSRSVIQGSSNDLEESSELVLNNLKLELLEKSSRVDSLEKEVDCLKSIEIDLTKTKSELESVLSSVSEDKKFYEDQLQSLQEKVSNQDKEIKRLNKVLFTKDEEIIKTTGDVQALREISLSLQEKLKEATELAEEESSSNLKEEISRLNLEITQREQRVKDLENELLAYKNDLTDEKELSDTLRSSLNIVTKEKLQLEEKLESIRIDNSNLVNALQTAEDNFERYVTAVRNLKNDLFSQNAACGPSESDDDMTSYESEVLKLKVEIIKLLQSNEQLNKERNTLLEEVERLKSTIASNDFAKKEGTITQLQEELKDLRKVVLAIKEEKLDAFSKFSSEINKLHEDINLLQDSKQEVVEKWKNELSEKQKFQKMYESIKTELDQRQQLNSKLEKLSFRDVNILDIPPVSYVPGLDALTEKMRKEIKLSATLDNSLLESILPDNNEPLGNENNVETPSFSNHDSCTYKIRSLEKALVNEIQRSREGKKVQREKENQCRDLENEKYELKLNIDRLGRLVTNQNEKITQLQIQVDSQKEKIITLELTLLKEQTSLKQVSTSLESERNKAREAQREDITLIETMRQRLQNLMENEIKLKKMVIDERKKSDDLLAQLNSVRAMEKYRSDSDDENHKQMKKTILNEREKYLALKVEYEKEKRTCEDLREVLARERTALCLQRDHLTKSERLRNQIEKELSVLKQKINEEVLRRQIAESKIHEVQECVETRFQRQFQALEVKNKKSLDAAYSIIHELEQEYNDLKRYLRNQQEQDDNWKENVHAPLIQQLNEVNDNLEALLKERVDLKRTIDRLNEENTRLHNLITELRMMSPRPQSAVPPSAPDYHQPDLQLRALEAIAPFMEREVDTLLHHALHEEHHRKALLFQKRYLLGALRGYQEAHSETVLKLQGHYYLRRRPSTRISFRSAAIAVIAAIKMTKLPLKRLVRYNKKKEVLLRSLKASLSRSTAEAERLASVASVRHTAPHSPPSRDRATQRYR